MVFITEVCCNYRPHKILLFIGRDIYEFHGAYSSRYFPLLLVNSAGFPKVIINYATVGGMREKYRFSAWLLAFMLLVANVVNTKYCKIPEKSLKPWHMGTHLRVLCEGYPMSTNMTGFRWFSKMFAFLCIGRKKS